MFIEYNKLKKLNFEIKRKIIENGEFDDSQINELMKLE